MLQFKVLNYFFLKNARNKIIAHCLNFDLIASGDSREEAERRLDVLVTLHIESYIQSQGTSGLSGPAPKRYWDSYTYALRHGGALPSSTLRIRVPDVVPMEKPYGDLEVVSAKAA